MRREVDMRQEMPEPITQTAPKIGLSQVFPETVAQAIEQLHAALQAATSDFGGTTALAAAMERPVPEVSLRLRRAQDSKGQIQRATLDMVGHIALDAKARHTFACALLDSWGYKPPELRREPTIEEKLSALLTTLKGIAGEAILERAADAGGFDVEAFRR